MYLLNKKDNSDFEALYLIQRKFVILKDTKKNKQEHKGINSDKGEYYTNKYIKKGTGKMT